MTIDHLYIKLKGMFPFSPDLGLYLEDDELPDVITLAKAHGYILVSTIPGYYRFSNPRLSLIKSTHLICPEPGCRVWMVKCSKCGNLYCPVCAINKQYADICDNCLDLKPLYMPREKIPLTKNRISIPHIQYASAGDDVPVMIAPQWGDDYDAENYVNPPHPDWAILASERVWVREKHKEVL